MDKARLQQIVSETAKRYLKEDEDADDFVDYIEAYTSNKPDTDNRLIISNNGWMVTLIKPIQGYRVDYVLGSHTITVRDNKSLKIKNELKLTDEQVGRLILTLANNDYITPENIGRAFSHE